MTDSFDSSTSDQTLVRAVRIGRSERAFGVLYDRHTPRAYQTARRILGGNIHEAEDAVQEAWARALASFETWSGEAAFGLWFRAIAAHVAVDIVRRDARIAGELDAERGIAADEASDRLDLESAILSLAPGYRAVLVLHDFEGFTHEEIAAQLGITAGTSKGQLFKARRAVRARLAPKTEGSLQ
jgi:RNA polymerase sigma-70 factor (ECF subfamily)